MRIWCVIVAGNSDAQQRVMHSIVAWVIGAQGRTVIFRAVPEFGSGSGRNPAFFLQIRLMSGSGQNWAGFQILPDMENFH